MDNRMSLDCSPFHVTLARDWCEQEDALEKTIIDTSES